MALKYRVLASNVPNPWRTAITPQEDSQGLYYTIDQLCDSYGPLPLSRQHIFADDCYKDSGSKVLSSYQEFYDSNQYFQQTIPELKYASSSFLALRGTTPGFYGAIDYDNLDNWLGRPDFVSKFVNCRYWQPVSGEGYGEAP